MPTDAAVTRKQARDQGQTWYFTGAPCKRGHLARRSVANSTCFDCANASHRERHGKAVVRQLGTGTEWPGRFTCSADVEAYVGRDTIECLICRKDGFGLLIPHLKARHRIGADAYRERFGLPAGVSLTSARSRDARDTRGPVEARRRKAEVRSERQDWAAALARVRSGELVSAVFTGKAEMPSRSDYAIRRRQDPKFRVEANSLVEGRQGGRLTPAEEAIIIERLKAGEPIARIASTLPVPRCASWIGRRRLFNPDFAERTASFWNPLRRQWDANRAERERRRAEGLLDRFAPQRTTEQFRTALRSDEVYGAVYAATARLPQEIRDDVVSDLVVALLDGEITVADLPREVGRFRTAHNRMFGGYAPSLDAPIGDGGFTLGNSLVAAYI